MITRRRFLSQCAVILGTLTTGRAMTDGIIQPNAAGNDDGSDYGMSAYGR